MRLSGERPQYVQPENLISFACRDCSRFQTSFYGRKVLVTHLFDFAGQFVRTEQSRADTQGVHHDDARMEAE